MLSIHSCIFIFICQRDSTGSALLLLYTPSLHNHKSRQSSPWLSSSSSRTVQPVLVGHNWGCRDCWNYSFFHGENSARQMISLRVQGNKIGLQTTKDHLKVFNKEHCQLRQNMMENRASESRTTPVPLHCATQLQKVGQELIKTKSSSWNSDNL